MLSFAADGSEDNGIMPIYIVGRAHSGSTILDVILNAHPDIKGCGEVLEALARGPDEKCSCGERIRECPKWSAVFASYQRRTGRDLELDIPVLYERTDIRYFASAVGKGGENAGEWPFYRQATRDLYAAIWEVFGTRAIVDSNKEYTRGLMVLRSSSKAKVIHIYRDPDITITSHYYRLGNGRPLKFMKRLYSPGLMRFPFMMLIAAGWSVGMMAALRIAREFPDRVLHVSHDEFSADPVAELERIGRFLEIDMQDVIERVRSGDEFPIEHLLGGNEFKHEGRIAFNPRTKGRRKAPWIYRSASWLFAWPGALAKGLFMSKNGGQA